VEVGTLSSTLAQDVQSGKVVRAIDWKVKDGWVRLGIPSRADGQARIEVLRTKSLSSDTKAPWGLDELN
jgi:hypothetical protein